MTKQAGLGREVNWPQNTMLYMTIREIKASMPKVGRGKFWMPRPTKPK